jgi:hypothetical protein
MTIQTAPKHAGDFPILLFSIIFFLQKSYFLKKKFLSQQYFKNTQLQQNVKCLWEMPENTNPLKKIKPISF